MKVLVFDFVWNNQTRKRHIGWRELINAVGWPWTRRIFSLLNSSILGVKVIRQYHSSDAYRETLWSHARKYSVSFRHKQTTSGFVLKKSCFSNFSQFLLWFGDPNRICLTFLSRDRWLSYLRGRLYPPINFFRKNGTETGEDEYSRAHIDLPCTKTIQMLFQLESCWHGYDLIVCQGKKC